MVPLAQTAPPPASDADAGTQLSPGPATAVPRSVPPIRSRITSTKGVPIAGAEVSWTPIPSAGNGQGPAWPDLDWKKLEAASLRTSSDRNGDFEFEAPLAAGEGESSVIWITAAGFEARAVPQEPAPAPPLLPAELELQPTGVLEATVVDGDGRPLGGAVVTGLPYLGNPTLIDPRGAPLEALRVLRRSYRTDSAGRVDLPSLPGINWVWAESSALRSKPWAGRPPTRFALRLAPTFSARGRVHPPPGSARAPGGCVRIGYLAGSRSEAVARSRVRTDGGWGPVELPAAACDRIEFSLEEGDGWTNELEFRDLPSPGNDLIVDFHPGIAIDLPVRVTDHEGLGIAHAVVEAVWYSGGGWHREGAMADAEGNARIRGCPPCVVLLTAQAVSYAQRKVEVDCIAPLTAPAVIVLEKGGLVRGRCTHRGQPVPNFRIQWWRGEAHEGDGQPFTDRADGTFTLEHLPLDEIRLVACADDLPQSPVARVRASAEPASEVELVLPDEMLARGTVVAAASGQPIPGATVQMWISDRSASLALARPLVRVDSQGRFECGGFVVGTNVYEASAPGFQTKRVMREIVTAGTQDLGLIPLLAQQSLEVVLVPDSTEDMGGYSAELLGGLLLPPRDFSAEGILEYVGLDPGSYVLRIHSPDGLSYEDVDAVVRSDRKSKLRVPVTSRRMSVEVVAENEDHVPEGLTLRLTHRKDGDLRVGDFYGIPADGRVQVFTPEGSVTVEVMEPPDTRRGIERCVVRNGVPDVLRVRIGAGPWTFRVMDEHLNPVPAKFVTVRFFDAPGDWWTEQISDERGECAFFALPPGPVLVSVGRLPEGIMPSVRVDLGEPGSRPLELTFDPACMLEVAVRERGAAVPGVALGAYDARTPDPACDAVSDDQGRASFCRVGKGDWRIRVMHTGFWPDQPVVTVNCAEGAIPVEVRRLGSIELRLRTRLGAPACDVAADLFSEERGEWVSSWIAAGLVLSPPGGMRSDAKGELRIEGLPNGPFQWRVRTQDGEWVEGVVVIPASSRAVVDVTLP